MLYIRRKGGDHNTSLVLSEFIQSEVSSACQRHLMNFDPSTLGTVVPFLDDFVLVWESPGGLNARPQLHGDVRRQRFEGCSRGVAEEHNTVVIRCKRNSTIQSFKHSYNHRKHVSLVSYAPEPERLPIH